MIQTLNLAGKQVLLCMGNVMSVVIGYHLV